MKKGLLACSLLMAMIYANTANAENVKTLKNNVNLNEIILNNSETSSPSDSNYNYNVLMASDSTSANTASLEKTLENKVPSKKGLKGFHPILNLQGGVQKAQPTAQPTDELTTDPLDKTIEETTEIDENTMQTGVEKTVLKQWIDGDYATGKWFGARQLLEDHGLKINSSLLTGSWGKTRGGMNDSASGKNYTLYNLGVTFDTEKAGLWKGGTFFALYQNKRGYGLSGGAMGDAMVLDGWDFREMNQISECWYQQKFFDNKIRVKLGKQDANTDFAYLNSGWDFLNTSFTIMPIAPIATYPNQSFGFMAEINPKEWLSIRDGIYSLNNVPFNVTEIEVKPTIKGLPGRYSVGAWETSNSNGFDIAGGVDYSTNTIYNNTYYRNMGMYAQFEQMLYKEKKHNENDMQGLIAFGQFGVCPSDKNDLSRYVGGGLEYIGPIPKRDRDKVGIAVASGAFASRLGNIASVVGSETSLEAFYRVQVNNWFYIQPDVQFIMNPGGSYTNSVAIGLRTAITF